MVIIIIYYYDHNFMESSKSFSSIVWKKKIEIQLSFVLHTDSTTTLSGALECEFVFI